MGESLYNVSYPVKMQSVCGVHNSKWDILVVVPYPKAQGTPCKRGQRGCVRQRPEKTAVKHCVLLQSELLLT